MACLHVANELRKLDIGLAQERRKALGPLCTSLQFLEQDEHVLTCRHKRRASVPPNEFEATACVLLHGNRRLCK